MNDEEGAQRMAAAAQRPKGPLSPTRAIAYAALTVAALDIVYAIVFWHLRGAPAIRVFQGVAAGLLGRDAFEGGLPTAVLGGFLHLFNATVIVTIYHLASRRLGFLNRRPVLWGLVYGPLVFLVMNYIVVPLSAAVSRPLAWSVFAINVVSHALFVGLPCALFARAAAREPAGAPAQRAPAVD